MENKKTVIAYFDGFNYYEGLRSKKWKHYYWQDFVKFSELFLRKHQTLKYVRYFTAIQNNKEKAIRQDLLFQANKLNPKFSCCFGEFKRRNKWRRVEICGKKHSIQVSHWEEKKTDVALACYMIRDVVLSQCDVSILFCADGDLTPAIDVIKELKPNHKIIVFFPPGLFSYDLKNNATKAYKLDNYEKHFKNALLPNEITLPDGYIIKCPEKWL